jgi:stage II sporulation protein GA (sporulation sigma-E factor processing peptidase)
MTVYLVAGLAFLVELMLLLGAGRLWGFFPNLWRCVAGAVIGAVYTVACLVPDLGFLNSFLWRMVFAVLTGLATYGGNLVQSLRFALLYLGVSLLAQAADRENLPAAALAATGLWMLYRSALQGRTFIPLELYREGIHLNLTALRDTGNTLRDPVTGEQVLVLSPEAAFTLTGLTAQQLRSPLDTLQRHPIPGLKLIPYRAVGSSGFLLGLRFPDAKIGGRRRSIVAAFAPEGLGRGDTFQALAGGFL